MALCWSRPVWSCLLLAGGLCAQLWFWREKADAAMMIAAAMLGTPSELLCVNKGVWTYYAPGLVLGVPVWIPLMWAYLLCLFRRISISIHSATLKVWPSSKMRGRKLLFGIAGVMILVYYLASVALISRTIAVAYTIFMISAMVFCRSEIYILIFIIGAALGTLGEYICMKLGFWQYHYPYFRSIGIPISLPLAWGLSSVIVGRVASIFAVEKTTTQPCAAQACQTTIDGGTCNPWNAPKNPDC